MSDDGTPWYLADAVDLLRRQRTLHLATVSGAGAPLASVAPFVAVAGELHVFVSALASHTGNLREAGQCSVLVARDESGCADPFARPRLTCLCRADEEPRGTAHWEGVLERMVTRLGDTAATVRELPDFALFRLVPLEGTVVSGFARAQRLDAAALRDAVREAGG